MAMLTDIQTNRPRWLTEKQVAALTGISCSLLQKLRFKGTGFPYVKVVARHVRYSEAEITKYMQEHQILTDN